MRITGGTLRSRVLVAPRGDATRPTTDRVREALFSMLEARGAVREARVLDLYAGSGALGLEALSRGAVALVAVERAREAARAIERNVTALGVGDRARVMVAPAERALAVLAREAFAPTLVFVDPPYADVGGEELGRVLASAFALADAGAVLVLEHSSRDRAPNAPPPHTRGETRRYGDSSVTFYEKGAPEPQDRV